jgi:hypothetical protein
VFYISDSICCGGAPISCSSRRGKRIIIIRQKRAVKQKKNREKKEKKEKKNKKNLQKQLWSSDSYR